MLLSGILSTLVGSGAAIFQGIFETKQQTKRAEVEQKLQNERFAIEQNTLLEIAKSNIDIEKYKSIIAVAETSKAESQTRMEGDANFTNAVVELTKVADAGKFIKSLTASVRPVSTYYMLFLLGVIVTLDYIGDSLLEPETVSFVAGTLDYIIAFWFVRRSYDKTQSISGVNLAQKKK